MKVRYRQMKQRFLFLNCQQTNNIGYVNIVQTPLFKVENILAQLLLIYYTLLFEIGISILFKYLFCENQLF